MNIRWKDQPYNEWLHLRLERYGKRHIPRIRYLIRCMRKQRKLSKLGAIPVDYAITGGEVITSMRGNKVLGRAIYAGSQVPLTRFIED